MGGGGRVRDEGAVTPSAVTVFVSIWQICDCCDVRVLHSDFLFSDEVCGCDLGVQWAGRCAAVLSCLLVELSLLVNMVLTVKGIVTGGVCQVLHLVQVQVFVHCLV